MKVLTKTDVTIIKRFLVNPNDEQIFGGFFEFCFREARGLVWYMRKSNYPLPIEKADLNDAINDLALNSLSKLFLKESGNFHKMVLSFMKSSDFQRLTEEQLYFQFIHKFRRKIRQEISILKDDDNPDIGKLRRSFNEILNSGDFIEVNKISEGSKNKNPEYAPKPMTRKTDSQFPHIDKNNLLRIVNEAYMKTTMKTKWCHTVFDLLSREHSFRKSLRKYDLINAAIEVQLNAFESHALWQGNMPDPKSDFLARRFRSVIDEVLGEIKNNEIKRYIAKKKINDAQAGKVLRAVYNYLTDVSNGNGTDPVPEYFREQFSDVGQSEYLKNYKNMMDSLTDRARENMMDKLK